MKKALKSMMIIGFLLITSFGYAQIDPGKSFDLQAYINGKIALGEKEIILPAGRLRVPEGQKNAHLYFENQQNITLIGDNTELICTETIQAIKLVNCTNFKIQGLSIDFDPLPFTQGVIRSISSDKSRISIDFIPGYSTKVVNDRVEIFDANSGELSTHTYYGITYTVDASARKAVITKRNDGRLSYSKEKVGDIVVLDSEGTKRIPHAVVIQNSTGTVMENVKLYAGTSFGFFETDCTGSRYSGCKIIRRPLESDLRTRGVRRMRSNNLDGFHSKHALQGPTYSQCIVQYNGDDGFAVNGHYHIITAVSGNILTVIGKAGAQPNISVGDSVELVSYQGERIPDAKVVSIKMGRTVSAAEKTFLNNQQFLAEAEDTRNATNVYEVEINRSVSLPIGSLIASSNRLGNGAKVIGCLVGPTRSRGILLKSSNVTVEGNTINGTWGMAIKMSPEYSWLEAGTGNNIKILNNTITDSRDPAIAVYAFGGNGNYGVVGSHRNVEISGNVISNSLNPAIVVTSTSDLLLEDNRIESPENSFTLPWKDDFGRSQDINREIFLLNVEEVVKEVPLSSIHTEASIKVFPNPTQDYLQVVLPNGVSKRFSIYDSLNRKLFESETDQTTIIDTSKWSPGIYFLKYDNTTFKIIKR